MGLMLSADFDRKIALGVLTKIVNTEGRKEEAPAASDQKITNLVRNSSSKKKR